MNINDYIFINKKTENDNQLFCSEYRVNIFKKLIYKDLDLPIIINGLEGIGKKYTFLYLLKYLKKFNESDININLNNFKLLDYDIYQNLYHYSNIFYYNCKFEKNERFTKLLDNISKIFKSKLFIDHKKIFIISNFDKLNSFNQVKFTNYIEKYYNNVSFIFTISSLVKLNHKIKSLSFIINYKPLEKEQFTSIFENNFKIFFEDNFNFQNKKLFLDYFYKIYVNNKFNIGNTLHQINYLYLKEKINKKEMSKKINLMSIDEAISIKLVNYLLKYKKMKDISIIRKKIYDINVLGINLNKIVKNILKNLLNIDSLNSSIKYDILEISNEFNIMITNSDKPIIIFENFIIKLWIKLNNF